MLLGNQLQQAIYVAAKLGLADLLKDGPRQSQDLARDCGAHPDSLYRLLRALAGFGIFTELEHSCFALTPLASFLQSEGEESVRALALWSGEISYQAFAGLEFSVLNGRPAFEHHYGMEFFEYLNEHPEVGNLFDEMMSMHTQALAPWVAKRDFSWANNVVDVGGGRGELLLAILQAHPSLHGVLIDQPRAIAYARRSVQAQGLTERCTTVCGNIFESLPRGADVYLLKSVIHGFNDTAAMRLLKNCRDAMDTGAKLFLLELVIPPGNDPFPGKLMDLLMLVGCYGRERNAQDFHALLHDSRFDLTSIVPSKYGYSLVEGTAT